MKCIKKILDNKGYENLSFERICKIAKREFCKFDDDELKIEFLTKSFERLPKEELGNNSPVSCAKSLVEGGTFEDGWNILRK